MATVPAPVRTGKPGTRRLHPPVPAPEVIWIDRPVLPCWEHPAGLCGMILLDETPYMVVPLGEVSDEGTPIIRGWRLLKDNGTVYDIDAVTGSCDCGDFTFREREDGHCKHTKGLLEALGRIGLDEPPSLPECCYYDPADDAISDDEVAPPF